MHDLDELDEPRGGALARCDARVKLVVAVAAILAVVASTRVGLPLGVLTCCLAVLIARRTPWRVVAGRLAAPVAAALFVVVLQGLMTGRTPLAAADLGPWRIAVTREGLLAGSLCGARVLGSFSVLLVLCLATSVEDLFAALRWARMPRTWIEIGTLMYRYTFTLFDQAMGVLTAQRIRLGYAGIRRSLGSLGSLAGVVALRSIDQAQRTHEAMVARGYHGLLPIPSLPPLSRRDRWIIVASVAVIASVTLLSERWFT